MTCPKAPEIKSRLLSHRYKALLQEYIDRWRIDPKFLLYHRASTILALRHELSYAPTAENPCHKCDSDNCEECQMAEVLQEAIKERISEESEKASNMSL
jgi:hypothetical protein